MKKCYLVDKKTGEVVEENFNYLEERDKERMKIFAEKNIAKEIYHQYQDDYLGKFVFFMFDNLSSLTEILNDTDLVSFMYIGTFVKKDGTLKLDNNKTYIDKNKLKSMLNMSKPKFRDFWNTLIENQLILEDNGMIFINLFYFYRGSESDYKKLTNKKKFGKNFTRLYIETTRSVFENTGVRSLRKLALIYKLLPYVNWRYNILCKNIHEENKRRLQLLTVEDIANLTGYDTSNMRKFKQDLHSLKYNGMSIFGRFSDSANSKNDMILINPLFYHRGSNLDELNFLANIFDIKSKIIVEE